MKESENVFLLVGIILIVILIPTVSAWEFDNVKAYDTNSKTATITNAFGLGDKLAEVTLLYNTDYCITDCYADIKLVLKQDYTDSFKAVQFYQLSKTKSVLGTKELTYKIKQETGKTSRTVIDYSNVCVESKEFWENSSRKSPTCELKETGSHVETTTQYKDYAGGSLTAGTYYFRLEGKKGAMETIEWIPNFLGIDISEWAQWSSSLNVGLFAYYTLDEATGANSVESVFGIMNGTPTDNPVNVSGVIRGAKNFSNPDKITIGDYSNFDSQNFTINAWFRYGANADSYQYSISKDFDAGGQRQFMVGLNKASHDGEWYAQINNGGAGLFVAGGTLELNKWHMITFIKNDTGLYLYDNSTLVASELTANTMTATTAEVRFGNSMDGNYMTGSIDEIGFWNRSLGADEVVQLYNDGAGMTYDANPLVPALNVPAPGISEILNSPITFNCSVTGTAILNLSLLIDGNFNYTITNTSAAAGLLSLQTNLTPTLGAHTWTCSGANSALSRTAPTRAFTIIGIEENAFTYNATTYETATESYSLNANVSSAFTSSSAVLWYNGTEYAATGTAVGNSVNYTASITHASGDTGTKNFKWLLYLTNSSGSTQFNSTGKTQVKDYAYFQICNTTVNQTYFNATFQDETTSTKMNGTIPTTTWTFYIGDGTQTKTYIYSNTSTNVPEYDFCFSPPDKTLSYTASLQYAYTNYPQRTWTSTGTLTNTTTSKTFYLLGGSDGSYSTYITQSSAAQSISGVTVQVERQIGGVWTLIDQGTTDSAGSITFWLNYNFDHRLTFTKTGYVSNSVTLKPSQSTYTITMTTGTGDAVFNSSIEGTTWYYYPSSGFLPKSTIQTFGLIVNATKGDLTACKFRLLSNTSGVLNESSTGCSAYGGNVTISINTTRAERIWGEFSLWTTSSGGFFVVDADAYWITNITSNIPNRGTLNAFFSNLIKIKMFGSDEVGVADRNRAEFSRIVLFFIILTIMLGILTYSTGWDFATSGGVLILLMLIVWGVSVSGFLYLENLTGNVWFDKYYTAIFTTMITAGYMMNKMRRDNML